MPEPNFTILNSVSQLRQRADDWDDLWLRSDATMPTLRAELTAQWIEQFAPQSQFRAVIVEHRGRLAAALPLVDQRIGPMLHVGGLPANEWSCCGELLLDPHTEVQPVLAELAQGLTQLPWPLLWLDAVALESSRWQAALDALDDAGMASQLHQRYRVGWIDTAGDWSDYRMRWTPKHRNNMARTTRRLQQQGELQLRLLRNINGPELEAALREGFEIEDRNWKGQQQTSVLQSDGMYAYLAQQAKQLADRGELVLAFLDLDQQPIAFIYAYHAKGIFHGYKIGYDQRYAKESPGQLLLHQVLEEMYADPQQRGMDCLGPVSPAINRWLPRTYGIGRLVVAPRRLWGKFLLSAYKHVVPLLRRLRKRSSP